MSTVTHQVPAQIADDTAARRRPGRLRVSPERIRRIRRSEREHALRAAKPWKDSRNW